MAEKPNLKQRPDVVAPHEHSLADLPVGFGAGKIPPQATILKQRVVLADLPAAMGHLVVFGAIPAGQVVSHAFCYVNEAPTGGGVSTCVATVAASAPPGANYIEVAELFGFVSPAYLTQFTAALPAAFELTAGDVHDAARTGAVQFTADVNLNTLVTFDVTAYIVLSPVQLTAP